MTDESLLEMYSLYYEMDKNKTFFPEPGNEERVREKVENYKQQILKRMSGTADEKQTVFYGIFGTPLVVNSDGSIDLPVIIQESGCYTGAPPEELRIVHVCNQNEVEINKKVVEDMNVNADLPYYLKTARIKML